MQKKNRSAYLPNLDGLRFIGALFIILFHIEGIKKKVGLPIIHSFFYFHSLGNLDVTLFFVLSGFIITYLLLKEKESSNTINLKNFYIRRILKIWPLYFFIVFIGLIVLPHFDIYFYNDYSNCVSPYFFPNFISCLFFIPPFMHGLPLTIGATWSVRVEEFFYLFWPIFLKKKKNFLKVCLWIILGLIILRNGCVFLIHIQNHYHIKSSQLKYILTTLRILLIQYRISAMAIGGIGAYLVIFDKQKILSFIYKKEIQWALYIITFVLMLTKIRIPYIHWEFYSILFAIIIVNLATNPHSILKLDYPWMNYLGKISYGLYLYNPIMRIFCLELVEHFYRETIYGWQMNFWYYFLTIFSTIAISSLSYHLMEKPFLNLKKYFVSIK
ncbi:MAG TPA: acyltransferase [Bacteroidia bacterium]|nr:acyltransferase [Bacteroidia bacterium]